MLTERERKKNDSEGEKKRGRGLIERERKENDR